MTKAELRPHLLQLRKALATDEVKRRSQLIAERFFDFLARNHQPSAPATIHTFLPIQRQNEVDTWPIIRGIWANYGHLNIAVPVTNVPEHRLIHYLLFPQTVLVTNRWGIPEPIITDQPGLSPISLDIILVPLLAFDQQGQRIGYGGGYYDRFLAECRADCLTIGLSLFDPIERIEATEQTDVPLKVCLTPRHIYRFK